MSTDPFASVGGKPLPRIDDEGDSLGDDFEASVLRTLAALPATVGFLGYEHIDTYREIGGDAA